MGKSQFLMTISQLVRELLKLRSSDARANLNQMMSALKEIDILRLNVKNMGYQIGQSLRPYLETIDVSDQPKVWNLPSKPTTQQDVESPWFRYWCNELKIAPIYHRKLWEFAFLLQGLYDHTSLNTGLKGIGFGCGEEPMASYFASKGIDVVATDLEPDKVTSSGWIDTRQHATSLEMIFQPDLCTKDQFERHVAHEYVNMNFIPAKFTGQFDFCWSICAMEHLGSIEKGLAFVENSLKTLKPGGIAIHTTEYNYLSENLTIDNRLTVLFLKKHFELLAKRVKESGDELIGPTFDVGNGFLDRFVDVPPYFTGNGKLNEDLWSDVNQSSHLKLAINGFASTCFGIIILKK